MNPQGRPKGEYRRATPGGTPISPQGRPQGGSQYAQRNGAPASPRRRGNAILLVMVLLAVMTAGALTMARIAEVGTLAGGNVASSDAAMQASEVGLNTAFAAVRGLADDNVARAGWYWPVSQAVDGAGIPAVAWDAAPTVAVGQFTVAYTVERMCNVTPVTDTLRQCLVRQMPQTESNRDGAEKPDPPSSRQFRVTVRVTGPKDTQVWTQSLVTRGN
jgi:Tfp pilus assembly protein PilX